MHRTRHILAAALFAAASLFMFADARTELTALTDGQHTRVVWLEGGDVLHGGGRIMGYDSRTNTTHQIVPASMEQNRPVLFAGGTRVYFCREDNGGSLWVVNWNGSGMTKVFSSATAPTPGIDGERKFYSTDVWIHPQTDQTWLVFSAFTRKQYKNAYRTLLEDPTQVFVLWNRTGIGEYNWPLNYYQISPDGHMAIDMCMGRGTVLDEGGLVSNGDTTHFNTGCWSTLAKDNSRYWYHYNDFGHTQLAVYNYKTRVDTVHITVPGMLAGGTYHVKSASRGARFLVLSSKYQSVNVGGPQVEIYAGKWNSSYTGFDGWARISNDNQPSYTPDMWVGVDTTGSGGPDTSWHSGIRTSSATLNVAADLGGSAPAPQQMACTTSAPNLQPLTAGSTSAWLTVSVTTLNASSGHYLVSNTVSPAGLAAGLHTATVTLRAGPGGVDSTTYLVLMTVRDKPLSFTSSYAGKTMEVGSTQLIKFSANREMQIIIEVSPDDGENWYSVSGSNKLSRADTMGYRWVVPPAMLSTQGVVPMVSDAAMLRIWEYNNIENTEAYSETFRIVPASAVVPGVEMSDRQQSVVVTPQGIEIRGQPGTHVAMIDLKGSVVRSGIVGNCALLKFSGPRLARGTYLVVTSGRDGPDRHLRVVVAR